MPSSSISPSKTENRYRTESEKTQTSLFEQSIQELSFLEGLPENEGDITGIVVEQEFLAEDHLQ
jgi:hypothetical protein